MTATAAKIHDLLAGYSAHRLFFLAFTMYLALGSSYLLEVYKSVMLLIYNGDGYNKPRFSVILRRALGWEQRNKNTNKKN